MMSKSKYNMAGSGILAIFNAHALDRRGQLRCTYNFLCLFYAKSSTNQKKVPHAISNRLGVIHTNVSDWFYK